MELSLQVVRQDYCQHERREDKRSGPESQDSGERLGGRGRHDTYMELICPVLMNRCKAEGRQDSALCTMYPVGSYRAKTRERV